jgi:hypothetical protein
MLPILCLPPSLFNAYIVTVVTAWVHIAAPNFIMAEAICLTVIETIKTPKASMK